MNNRAAAIIVAAGQATRFGAPKLLTPIGGIPAVLRCVNTFIEHVQIDAITLVVAPELRSQIETIIAAAHGTDHISIVDGGARRQDSVASGLESIGDAAIVVIHDGARPLVNPTVVSATIEAIGSGMDAAIAAIPVTDTIKRLVDGSMTSVDRSELWRAQTPQAFRTAALRAGLERARTEGWSVTDEGMLIERYGGRVVLVPGDERAMKLTVPNDAVLIEAMFNNGVVPVQRSGIGYDVHRLVAGRPLILGGVHIPYERGLDGHSDADVVVHAVADAILGSCALGDIGTHFPPDDEQYRGADSIGLLERARDLVIAAGGSIINVDVMVIAEEPRIGPFVVRMREALARALGISTDYVSIKATTNEGMGFTGRGEGIAALATASVLQEARS